MDGWPVWLASISRRDSAGRIIGTADWSHKSRRWMATLLREHVLAGVGDPSRQRCFRMNITLCIHRALTEREVADLVPQWRCGPGPNIAGPPVEILWEVGCTTSPSGLPCESPRHVVVRDDRPDLWLPGDCGACEPCRARAAIEGAAR
jgi:hypothetical protein